MQIKHQAVREDVFGMPKRRRTTVIKNNLWVKSENSGTGEDGRPSLLVGDQPPSGFGSDDGYVVTRNLFFENQSGDEPLFQGEGHFTFSENVLINSYDGGGVVVRPHNGDLRDIYIGNNTILTKTEAIMVIGLLWPTPTSYVASSPGTRMSSLSFKAACAYSPPAKNPIGQPHKVWRRGHPGSPFAHSLRIPASPTRSSA